MTKVVSVNVGLPKLVDWNGKQVRTAIWKNPVAGRVKVRPLNFEGDGQADLGGHGGPYRAVMVYQLDSYTYWRDHFGQLEIGAFGENLTVDGLPDSEVCVGDQLRIGDALFEVTAPRVTCYRLGIRLKEPQAAALLISHRRPGFYLRVLAEGTVAAGDEVTLVSRNPDSLSIADISALLYLPDHPKEKLEKALRIPALSPGWQGSFRALLAAAAKGESQGNVGLSTAHAAAWKGFRPVKIVSKTRESDEVESILFASEDGASFPSFLPGQHLVVRINPGDGQPKLLRNYSLACAPAGGTFRIGVKREPQGLVSTFIHQNLKIGDLVEISAPRGDFVLPETDTPVVLISAGVGVTPMLAMLYAVAQSKQNPARPVYWIHSARDSRHHPFAEESRKLLTQMPNATSCILYTRPLPTDKLAVTHDAEGHLTTAHFDQLSVPKSADFFLCGPATFMNSISDQLKHWSASAAHIHIELFGAGESLTPGIQSTTQKPPHPPEGPAGDGPQISFTRSGLTVPWSSRFKSLLELAEACDVPVKFACRTGVCHTCECGLIDGAVTYNPDPLDPASDGNALICCSTPQTAIQLDL
jgi:ferredoxin-NADP reductase/MOSC domain-containing protein YiiM